MKTIVMALLAVSLTMAVGLPSVGAQKQITFWTSEVEKDRLEIQKEIGQEFTDKTGIPVRVIPVEENLTGT